MVSTLAPSCWLFTHEIQRLLQRTLIRRICGRPVCTSRNKGVVEESCDLGVLRIGDQMMPSSSCGRRRCWTPSRYIHRTNRVRRLTGLLARSPADCRSVRLKSNRRLLHKAFSSDLSHLFIQSIVCRRRRVPCSDFGSPHRSATPYFDLLPRAPKAPSAPFYSSLTKSARLPKRGGYRQ